MPTDLIEKTRDLLQTRAAKATEAKKLLQREYASILRAGKDTGAARLSELMSALSKSEADLAADKALLERVRQLDEHAGQLEGLRAEQNRAQQELKAAKEKLQAANALAVNSEYRYKAAVDAQVTARTLREENAALFA